MDEFTWTVALDGYEAFRLPHEESSETIAGWVVTEKWQSGQHKIRPYVPLRECRGLHRTFAATEPSVASVLQFTQRYGFLGNYITRILPQGHQSKGVRPFTGELVTEWNGERTKLAQAVRLWDAIRSKDQNYLASIVQKGPMAPEASAIFHYELDLKPALSELQRRVNDKLAALKIQPVLIWDLDRVSLKNALAPRDLLGAIWVEFAIAVGMNRGKDFYLNCAGCGAFFERGISKRRDARYCSDACKSRAYRRRSMSKRN